MIANTIKSNLHHNIKKLEFYLNEAGPVLEGQACYIAEIIVIFEQSLSHGLTSKQLKDSLKNQFVLERKER